MDDLSLVPNVCHQALRGLNNLLHLLIGLIHSLSDLALNLIVGSLYLVRHVLSLSNQLLSWLEACNGKVLDRLDCTVEHALNWHLNLIVHELGCLLDRLGNSARGLRHNLISLLECIDYISVDELGAFVHLFTHLAEGVALLVSHRDGSHHSSVDVSFPDGILNF